MATTDRNKLNSLYRQWVAGTPLTSGDLAAQGISADLAVHYVRAGWMCRLARGVYCRPKDKSACALHEPQNGAAVPAIGARTLLALGRKAGSRSAAYWQRPCLGVPLGRWVAGAQAMNQTFPDTARLLTQIAPLVFADGTFALKGGTAINLFIRNMPRLSVDLDLVFTDHRLARGAALARINEAVRQSAERLAARGFKTHTLATADAGETKLLVRRAGIEVKVEVNFVMRGTVYPVQGEALADLWPAPVEIQTRQGAIAQGLSQRTACTPF